MNNDIEQLLFALPSLLPDVMTGISIGIFFFYSIWITVQKGLKSPHPARWFLGGLLLRMSVSLTGFYLVFDGQWQSIVACLLGFVLARRLTGSLTQSKTRIDYGLTKASPSKELDHATKP